MNQEGVTFVVPVHNGQRWLDEMLTAILAERDGRPFEVIAIDDGSTDLSAGILARWEAEGHLHVRRGEGRGAAAALNMGIRAARNPIVCLVDQDVAIQPGWLARLADALAEPGVGAAQGRYVVDRSSPIVARVMGLDLEQRYASLRTTSTDHVCTGNSAYRTEALRAVGLFDESFGYGYDNDMSYRLAEAGRSLRFCSEATAVHRCRDSWGSYLLQQYGLGYGRLDLVAKHRRRVTGDSVSPMIMMAHAPLMLGALGAGLTAAASRMMGGRWHLPALLALVLVGALALERLAAGVRATLRQRDPAGMWFAPIHLLRDVAWAVAVVVWSARRIARRDRRPSHSMRRERR
jgi:cellulose synthase/poly-beta-1,6-N-acetylglucosamine synthase-like glycosyltransferase